MKTCTKCKEEKDLSEFGKRSGAQSHLYNSWCKSCRSAGNAARLNDRYHNEPGFKDKMQEWRDANPDKIKEYRAKEYQKHRQAYLDRASAWTKANPALVSQIKRRYKSKRKVWEMTGSFTQDEWDVLCDYYGKKCLSCGRTDAKLTVDHVVPLSVGGTNSIENIQPLCGSCNSSKGTKTIDYRS